MIPKFNTILQGFSITALIQDKVILVSSNTVLGSRLHAMLTQALQSYINFSTKASQFLVQNIPRFRICVLLIPEGISFEIIYIYINKEN